jgi:hypothetical protein
VFHSSSWVYGSRSLIVYDSLVTAIGSSHVFLRAVPSTVSYQGFHSPIASPDRGSVCRSVASVNQYQISSCVSGEGNPNGTGGEILLPLGTG